MLKRQRITTAENNFAYVKDVFMCDKLPLLILENESPIINLDSFKGLNTLGML